MRSGTVSVHSSNAVNAASSRRRLVVLRCEGFFGLLPIWRIRWSGTEASTTCCTAERQRLARRNETVRQLWLCMIDVMMLGETYFYEQNARSFCLQKKRRRPPLHDNVALVSIRFTRRSACAAPSRFLYSSESIMYQSQSYTYQKQSSESRFDFESWCNSQLRR